MTLEQYRDRIAALAKAASQKQAEAIIIPAGNEMLALLKNRIIVDGKGSNNNVIGQYSTKSAYFSQSQFDKKSSFKPRGKVRTGTKTMYIETGYKGLREIQGKPVDNIKENYTGSTMAAYQQVAQQAAIVQGMTTKKASDIRKGQEQKKGKIYQPTQDELSDFKKNIIAATQQLTINILNGVSISTQ
jgi:hypothetical protein